jgi:hypothetical protein
MEEVSLYLIAMMERGRTPVAPLPRWPANWDDTNSNLKTQLDFRRNFFENLTPDFYLGISIESRAEIEAVVHFRLGRPAAVLAERYFMYSYLQKFWRQKLAFERKAERRSWI